MVEIGLTDRSKSGEHNPPTPIPGSDSPVLWIHQKQMVFGVPAWFVHNFQGHQLQTTFQCKIKKITLAKLAVCGMLFTYIYSIDNSFLGHNLRKRFEIVCATWFLYGMHKYYWRTTKKKLIYLSANCTTSNALLHIVKSCVLAWSCSKGNVLA